MTWRTRNVVRLHDMVLLQNGMLQGDQPTYDIICPQGRPLPEPLPQPGDRIDPNRPRWFPSDQASNRFDKAQDRHTLPIEPTDKTESNSLDLYADALIVRAASITPLFRRSYEERTAPVSYRAWRYHPPCCSAHYGLDAPRSSRRSRRERVERPS